MCLLSFYGAIFQDTTYESSVEFQMEISIIFRRGFRSQTTQILVISRCFFLERTAKRCTKFHKTCADLLFCPLNASDCHIIVSVAVLASD